LSRACSVVALFALALPPASCASPQRSTVASASVSTAPLGIGCLGRVEAGDGIVHLAARSLSGQPSIIGRLFVAEGDTVRESQIVAELESRGQLEAAARQAAAEIEVARSRLAQVRAGAKPSDLAAQRAEIERLQMELANAQQERLRYASLGNNVTAAQLDALQLRIDSTTRLLSEARERLSSLADVRAVDVDAAQAALEEASRSEATARAQRDASVIRAPTSGRVVKIHARPGEEVQGQGLLELAPLGPMYVVAEVAESDAHRVKTGQRASISGDGLPAGLQGTVQRIAMSVQQNQLARVDPVNFSDSHVVNAWIRVDDPDAVSNFLNMRVNVVIHP
jgi:HlyD family secretion protein